MLYFRTCGTFKTDEEIAKAEAHFEANKVTGDFTIQSTRNVIISSYKVRLLDPFSLCLCLQVYWHVISQDTTLAGGYIPSVSQLNVIDFLLMQFRQ